MNNLEEQKQKIEKLLSRFKYQVLKSEIREKLLSLYEKLEKPEEFIPEAVSDAKHDVELLCLIEDGIEILVKAVTKF